MNLYLISQSTNNGYDTYDSAVVAAESEQEAQKIHPNPNRSWDKVELNEEGAWIDRWGDSCGTWADYKSQVTVKYLGQAEEGTQSGVILASFNAG